MTKKAPLGGVIRAAGGLVWRTSRRGRLIALVHRPRYDDWSFPKGKLHAGEGWQDAAMREVEEETGFEVRLGRFAGGCVYLTKRTPKIVLYWHMRVRGKPHTTHPDPEEIDALEWMSPERARRRLTYARERRLLQESVSNGKG